MADVSRRRFLHLGAGAAATAAVAACSGGATKGSDRRSGSSTDGRPTSSSGHSGGAGRAKGTLSDVDHVVIFFQENRSFDQYFGTRKGVRGFADRRAPKGLTGKPAFRQPDPSRLDGEVLPFHFDSTTTSGQCGPDVEHSWEAQHGAWNGGRMDGFVGHMGANAMGYFTAADLPYYSAVADHFTLCDSYHAAVMGPTNPNRLYAWTATIDPSGQAGGPVIDNTTNPWTWETYPERLQRAGVSWRVYHQEDDFDDNTLKFFKNFQNLAPTDPLFDAALKNRAVSDFVADVATDNLPQVSWIVGPTALSEHPPFAPSAGEDLTRQYLDAFRSQPKVWAKTVFIFAMDENGGFFDHVAPPVPEPGTADELVGTTPIGLGFRVPTLVLSPWSRGGKVVSHTFDHTSTLRFLEKRFGVEVPHLSAWRRRTCGDLTSTLDFSKDPDTRWPTLPDTVARLDAVKQACATRPPAAPPAHQTMPGAG